MSVSRSPQTRRLPPWALVEGPFGIRPVDVGILVLAVAAVEVNVAVGGGYGASELDLQAYLLGVVIVLPQLFRNRWPLQVLFVSFAGVMLYYGLDRRNISPAPVLAVPAYDSAVAGYLLWAIVIPAIVMVSGLIAVGLLAHESAVALAADFYPSSVLLMLAGVLGELVRARRALAEETAVRLRLAEEERAAEAGRLVAEERLRIARELHDTVAHSMATITVQAGSALHLLSQNLSQNDTGSPSPLNAALAAIRETSKSALEDMRGVLGQLRGDEAVAASGDLGGTGLDRLPALRDAVRAAGTEVTVQVEGDPVALPPEADHAAYRILQESLTNVLRHAGPGAAATVRVCYQPDSVALSVTDTGCGDGDGDGDGTAAQSSRGSGHGINGMRERAAAVGGTLVAGCRSEGGFEVTASLPIKEPA